MPKILFKPNDVEVEVPQGTPVLDAALDNNIKINHNCGGNCACSTCHIIVESGYEALNENLSETSRLACQVKAKSDIVIRIPETVDDFEDDL